MSQLEFAAYVRATLVLADLDYAYQVAPDALSFFSRLRYKTWNSKVIPYYPASCISISTCNCL